jgi:NaMN:DMB phosphoribosyltransferase
MYSQPGNHPAPIALFALIGGFAMRVFLGMILGALLLVAGVYVYDSQSTSTVANGQAASANRTIVNWDVAATDWNLLKRRAQDDWIKLSSK